MYVEMTCALNFSQNASSPEQALEVTQFEVGMGSTHTILTLSPAPDVPNGKTKSRRSSPEVGAVFTWDSPEAFPQPKGNAARQRVLVRCQILWLSTLTSRTKQVVPHYGLLVVAGGTAQQSWPALPT